MTQITGTTEAELLEPARRAHLRPWKKGQSGNPGGLGAFYQQARKIVRDAAPELMRELVKLALTAEDERVKSVCLIAALDRAGLKPTEFNPLAENTDARALDLSKLTPEQRAQLRLLIDLAKTDQALTEAERPSAQPPHEC
jgi:hypothetical protein